MRFKYQTMCPKVNKRVSKKMVKRMKGVEMKARNRKSSSDITLSNLVNECCNDDVTSSRMLTHKFLKIISSELSTLAGQEKSETKVSIINQLSFDLSDFVSKLDQPHSFHDYNREDLETVIGAFTVDLKVSLMQLNHIDKLMKDLMSRRAAILERLESTYCSNIEVIDDDRQTEDMASLKCLNPPTVTEDTCDAATPPQESSNLQDITRSTENYFDGSVVTAAALSVQQVVPLCKREITVSENSKPVNLKKLTDYNSTHLLTRKDMVISAGSNGSLIRFCFKGSILPYIPHRTKSYLLTSGPFAQVIFWDNYIIAAAQNGTIFKCTLMCKVVQVFQVPVGISCMTESKGLLYVCSVDGNLHVINARSMTVFKDVVELGYMVKSIKSTVYDNSSLIACLTESGEIIGTTVTNGYIGSVAFKFIFPAIDVFDVGYNNNQSPQVVLCCGSCDRASILHLKNRKFSQRREVCFGPSVILTYDKLLFLGSKKGDILIVNLMTSNTLIYQNVVNEEIVSFAYLSSSLYVGTKGGVYYLCLANSNFDDATEP